MEENFTKNKQASENSDILIKYFDNEIKPLIEGFIFYYLIFNYF